MRDQRRVIVKAALACTWGKTTGFALCAETQSDERSFINCWSWRVAGGVLIEGHAERYIERPPTERRSSARVHGWLPHCASAKGAVL